MTSMVSTAVGAIVSALSSGTPVASQIARVRLRAFAQAVTQAVTVRPLQSEVGDQAFAPGYPISWRSSIAVECYARSGAAIAPDVAVDSLLEAAYARIMADTTLGGAVLDIQPQSISYDFDADGDQTTCATLVFTTLQRAAARTLS